MQGLKVAVTAMCLSCALILSSCGAGSNTAEEPAGESGLQAYDGSSAADEVKEEDVLRAYEYVDYVTLEYEDVSVRTAVLTGEMETTDASASGYSHGISMSASLLAGTARDAAERMAAEAAEGIVSMYGDGAGVECGDPDISGDYVIVQGSFSVTEGNAEYPGIIISAAMPVSDTVSLCFVVVADNRRADAETEAVLSEVLDVCGLSAG